MAENETFEAIRLLAQTEGLISDPVCEGKAIPGLMALTDEGRFEKARRVLLMHLGRTPAAYANANQFGAPNLSKHSL